jgi:hypothetical protein
MAKKKTRLEELEEYAKSVGLLVNTYSPGEPVVLRPRQRPHDRARTQEGVGLRLCLRGRRRALT